MLERGGKKYVIHPSKSGSDWVAEALKTKLALAA